MTSAQRARLQLRFVELAFRDRSPHLDAHQLERLRLRCDAILHSLKFVPGHDERFDAKLDELRRALRAGVG